MDANGCSIKVMVVSRAATVNITLTANRTIDTSLMAVRAVMAVRAGMDSSKNSNNRTPLDPSRSRSPAVTIAIRGRARRDTVCSAQEAGRLNSDSIQR